MVEEFRRYGIEPRSLDERIAAVQPAAVEEVQHPADWYVDPNAPDGCG